MRKILLMFSAIFMLISCSDDDSGAANSDGTLLKTINVIANGGALTYNFEFEYYGNYVTRLNVTSTPGAYDNYTYTGNLITRIDHFTNNSQTSIETLDYDSQERLIKRLIFGTNENSARRVDYIYNDNDHTMMLTVYDGDLDVQTTVSGKMKVYFEDSQLTKTETFSLEDEDMILTSVYTFDDKNSPYNGIVGYNRITRYESEIMTPHNCTSVTYSATGSSQVDTDVTEYTYNAADYMTQAIHIDPFDNDGQPLIFQYGYL
ncbi:MAG TPA: hypothetical protein VK528_09110 [Flavobacterium sp.]|nr:hypothetical protein [Flavobacterium sp.]